jgi:hypothetical protein
MVMRCQYTWWDQPCRQVAKWLLPYTPPISEKGKPPGHSDAFAGGWHLTPEQAVVAEEWSRTVPRPILLRPVCSWHKRGAVSGVRIPPDLDFRPLLAVIGQRAGDRPGVFNVDE